MLFKERFFEISAFRRSVNESFTSRFTESHTELDAHPLFVNFRHTADIRKSQTADAIHIKTRATIKRFHIQPRHSALSLTRHHRNTP